ncbi:MAG: hypothetical protein PHS37_00145 [Candidatus Omnitrophica bacterium]|nr:hypothetical protein [Candidatus Omnitrophota bacterium]
MKAIFVLQESDGVEILDPKNNIERLKRMRSINLKRVIGTEWNKVKKVLDLKKRYNAL